MNISCRPDQQRDGAGIKAVEGDEVGGGRQENQILRWEVFGEIKDSLWRHKFGDSRVQGLVGIGPLERKDTKILVNEKVFDGR